MFVASVRRVMRMSVSKFVRSMLLMSEHFCFMLITETSTKSRSHAKWLSFGTSRADSNRYGNWWVLPHVSKCWRCMHQTTASECVKENYTQKHRPITSIFAIILQIDRVRHKIHKNTIFFFLFFLRNIETATNDEKYKRKSRSLVGNPFSICSKLLLYFLVLPPILLAF